MAQKKSIGVDNDVDLRTFPAKAAHIVYWGNNCNVIANQTMYQETVYPLSLMKAIKVFAPQQAKGCNVTFESVTGYMTNTLVINF